MERLEVMSYRVCVSMLFPERLQCPDLKMNEQQLILNSYIGGCSVVKRIMYYQGRAHHVFMGIQLNTQNL